MWDYKSFIVEQYDKVSVLTWTKSAATRDSHNGDLRIELQAFVLTTKPSCVVVSFAQLRQCPSELIEALVGLSKQLKDRGSDFLLCQMNQQLREQFDRLHLDRVFEIHDSVADAIVACEKLSRVEPNMAKTKPEIGTTRAYDAPAPGEEHNNAAALTVSRINR